jgi:hypothetical protein
LSALEDGMSVSMFINFFKENNPTPNRILTDHWLKQEKMALSESLSGSPKIGKLLLEKIPLAGIARVVGVSEPWFQSYVNQKYPNLPRQVYGLKKDV